VTAKRNTWQKDAVKHALGEATGFVSAQDLHLVLRNHGSTIGLATVYRALADLAHAGEADSLQANGGETLFRACEAGHHHHLICTKCGDAVEISATEIETWANSVAKQHGFKPASHTIELFGICANCAD
jgi:Fur family transcriptional regulator, ferric uptake regulator